MPPPPLKALIFDLDGTLAETEEVHRQAFNDAFAEEGLAWAWDRETYRRLLTVAGGRERLAAFAPQAPPDLLDRLHRAKSRHFERRLAQKGVELRPGVAALFAQAQAMGLMRAVVTTSRRESALAVLAFHPQLGPLDALIAGEDAPLKKPAPDLYLMALEKLDVEASEALAIEDAAIGLKAALAAGIATLVTPSLYTEGQDFEGALQVRPSLEGVELENLWKSQFPNI